jgi:hypothetical protein
VVKKPFVDYTFVACDAKQREWRKIGLLENWQSGKPHHQQMCSLWTDINGDSISHFLWTLDINLGNTQALRKELSRYGAWRLGADEFVNFAQQQDLVHVDVWRTVANGRDYFLATQDPMNGVYASWIYNLLKTQGYYNKWERLGELVETGLGVLYLATFFPEDLACIIMEPGVMWRRLETSMTFRVNWPDTPSFGTSTEQCAPSLAMTQAVE